MSQTRRRERGLVTVELAVGLVTAVALVTILVSLVLLGSVQAAAVRTSSEVARQLARGDTVAAERAEQEAPPGTTLTTTNLDDGVQVAVLVQVRLPGLGPVHLSSTSWSRYEQGATP